MPGGKNLVLGTYIYALMTGMSVSDISGKAIASLSVKIFNICSLFFMEILFMQVQKFWQ